MRRESVGGQAVVQPWQAVDAAVSDARSAHVMRIIELAHTLASAETAVLTGNEAKAVEDLRRLQADTTRMLAELESITSAPLQSITSAPLREA